jgi:hypothetical protein
MCSKNGLQKVERENLAQYPGTGGVHKYCSNKQSYTPTPHPTHHQQINTQGLIRIIP